MRQPYVAVFWRRSIIKRKNSGKMAVCSSRSFENGPSKITYSYWEQDLFEIGVTSNTVELVHGGGKRIPIDLSSSMYDPHCAGETLSDEQSCYVSSTAVESELSPSKN